MNDLNKFKSELLSNPALLELLLFLKQNVQAQVTIISKKNSKFINHGVSLANNYQWKFAYTIDDLVIENSENQASGPAQLPKQDMLRLTYLLTQIVQNHEKPNSYLMFWRSGQTSDEARQILDFDYLCDTIGFLNLIPNAARKEVNSEILKLIQEYQIQKERLSLESVIEPSLNSSKPLKC